MLSMTNANMRRLAVRLAPLVSERLAARPRPSDLAGDPEALLTEIEAAAILALRPSTLCAWRSRGRGPAFRRLGQGHKPCVRYRHGDVIRFRDARAVTPGR